MQCIFSIFDSYRRLIFIRIKPKRNKKKQKTERNADKLICFLFTFTHYNVHIINYSVQKLISTTALATTTVAAAAKNCIV